MRNKNACVSDPHDFITCSGEQDRIIYKTKVMPDGTLDIQPSGKESIQAKIESFRPQTDMAFILKQMQLGNLDVLNGAHGSYGDFTQMPKTMAEAMQLRIDAEDAWYKLPVDTRAKFDHDLNKWLATAGTKEWSEIMSPSAPKDASVEPGTPLAKVASSDPVNPPA